MNRAETAFPLSFDEIADAVPNLASPDRFAGAEARIDAPRVLAAAPSITGEALRLIYLREMPMQDVAVEFQLSRFALRRQIQAFWIEMRRAA